MPPLLLATEAECIIETGCCACDGVCPWVGVVGPGVLEVMVEVSLAWGEGGAETTIGEDGGCCWRCPDKIGSVCPMLEIMFPDPADVGVAEVLANDPRFNKRTHAWFEKINSEFSLDSNDCSSSSSSSCSAGGS